MIALGTVAGTPLMGGMAGSGMAGGGMLVFPLVALFTVAVLLAAGVVGAGFLASGSDGSDASESDETPVERLQRRYAAGELAEDEFERALERELEREESGGSGTVSTGKRESTGEAARVR